MIEILEATTWEQLQQLCADEEVRHNSINALESGKVVYLPHFSFQLESSESALLSAEVTPKKNVKNISYNPDSQCLKALEETNPHWATMKNFLHRYSTFSQSLLLQLFPQYESHLIMARTSFRPVEIAGRQAPSYRKDDTRLHVDAFPSSPNQGRRLLRVFSNVNPHGKPRTWRLGDSFENVAKHFQSQLKSSPSFYRHALKHLKITKGLRTDYDELMLNLHDTMKGDLAYQRAVSQQTVDLAAGGTWIVYTDQASHAATAGQFCCEQTFMLPVESMQDPAKSPLKILERVWQRKLV